MIAVVHRLALCFLWLAACAGGQPSALSPRAGEAKRPLFMFTVERDGLPTTYLHGSVHMLKDSSDGREPAIDRAYERADALVVELDVAKVDRQAVQAMTLELGLYPEGDDLTRHIAPETWGVLAPLVADFGLPPEQVKRMRPWLLSITLSMLAIQRDGYSQEAGVDARYLRAAHAMPEPREVLALETAEEQLRALADLPEEVQRLMLEDTVGRLDDDAFFDRMFAAWRAGDVDGLGAVVFEPLREEPRFAPMYRSLFFERNRRMTRRLVALLQTRKRYFVVVGAAHLAGPESIPALLRAEGYRVEQVHTAARRAPLSQAR